MSLPTLPQMPPWLKLPNSLMTCHFQGTWVYQGGLILLLTPPDFFLWGMLKGKYQNKPQTLMALRKNIKREIETVTPEMLVKTFHGATCSNLPGW